MQRVTHTAQCRMAIAHNIRRSRTQHLHLEFTWYVQRNIYICIELCMLSILIKCFVGVPCHKNILWLFVVCCRKLKFFIPSMYFHTINPWHSNNIPYRHFLTFAVPVLGAECVVRRGGGVPTSPPASFRQRRKKRTEKVGKLTKNQNYFLFFAQVHIEVVQRLFNELRGTKPVRLSCVACGWQLWRDVLIRSCRDCFPVLLCLSWCRAWGCPRCVRRGGTDWPPVRSAFREAAPARRCLCCEVTYIFLVEVDLTIEAAIQEYFYLAPRWDAKITTTCCTWIDNYKLYCLAPDWDAR